VSSDVFPDWLKKSLIAKKNSRHLKYLFQSKKIYTVCQEAKCPNIGDCFARKTATFLLMGDICTRNCRFCAVKKGIPEPLDKSEPFRIASEIKEMNLKYAVLTSPTRDDLEDGGAELFARTVIEIKKINPDTKVEVLIPDFKGNLNSLEKVVNSGIDVLNHNVETVPRLYLKVRPLADYERSLRVLDNVSRMNGSLPLKSGFMVGLGEKKEEIVELLKDLKSVGCNIVTIGQYIRPTFRQLPVNRYVTLPEFKELEDLAYGLGFDYVASGPLVRSSYKAGEMFSLTL
jgi:lipoic acid synthetase